MYDTLMTMAIKGHVSLMIVAAKPRKCIPTTGLDGTNKPDAVDKVINYFAGIAGGLLFKLGPVMFLILLVAGLALIVTNKGSRFLKLAIVVLLVPFGAILAMAIYYGLMRGANGKFCN
jgi:hypothetical protein